jgi:prevent-host-death family protein
MRTVNIHEAKAHLSSLVEQAAKGESFIIAKAGKPLVKVMALNAPEAGKTKRLDFMLGEIAVPDDFDNIGRAEIESLFGGGSRASHCLPPILWWRSIQVQCAACE